jgi:hypothetical protein
MSQSCSDARAVAGTISRAAASAAISESFITATLVTVRPRPQRAGPRTNYGVVVESVNVSVFE